MTVSCTKLLTVQGVGVGQQVGRQAGAGAHGRGRGALGLHAQPLALLHKLTQDVTLQPPECEVTAHPALDPADGPQAGGEHDQDEGDHHHREHHHLHREGQRLLGRGLAGVGGRVVEAVLLGVRGQDEEPGGLGLVGGHPHHDGLALAARAACIDPKQTRTVAGSINITVASVWT